MQGTPRKAPFKCPSCGFVQHEPEHLISTYCRSCGDYYEAQAHRAGAGDPARALRRQVVRPPRTVHCYRCQQSHEVSASAHSTMCPICQTSIELGDLVFSSNVSRPIDMRGRLTVERTAYLNSSYIVCGEGFIEGRITGTLRCERDIHLASSGPINCRITAASVVIEKGADIEFMYPVSADELIVHGKARGQIDCSGTVRIYRRGLLEGKLSARSIVVDRGGVLLAETSIKSRSPEKPSGLTTTDTVPHETGGLGFTLPLDHQFAY